MFLIKYSKIDGKGLFADCNISEGEVFYNIPSTNISKTPVPHWARVDDRYIGDEKVLNWINHSCSPNAKIASGADPTLVAITDIKEGDEITCDYNVTEVDGRKFKCNCGSPDCKGYFLAEK